MTGGRSPRRARRRRAGAAAVGLLAAVLVFIGYKVLPVPDAALPVVLPQEFWSLLALVVVLGYLGYATLVRATPRTARRARKEARAVVPPPDAVLPSRDAVLPELETRSEPEIREPAAGPPARPVAARSDMEMSKLLEWIDGVSAQISKWTTDFGSHRKEEPPLEEIPPVTTTVIDSPAPLKPGAWTELRARREIEKLLRKKPWAHATDIAKTLDMDVGLAARVADSLRGEDRP